MDNRKQVNISEADSLLTAKEVAATYRIGESTLWAGVKTGRFPAPVKIGPRMTRWKSSEVYRVIKNAK